MVSPYAGDTVIRWNAATDFVTADEKCNAHTDSIPSTDTTVAANEFKALDLSAAFTGIAGGDSVGVACQREGNYANDTLGDVLHVHSFVMRYVQFVGYSQKSWGFVGAFGKLVILWFRNVVWK